MTPVLLTETEWNALTNLGAPGRVETDDVPPRLLEFGLVEWAKDGYRLTLLGINALLHRGRALE